IAAHWSGGTARAAMRRLYGLSHSRICACSTRSERPRTSRHHGCMVFDTLFAIDAEFAPHPQTAGEYSVSPDKLTYRFQLRDGLGFHDGSPVRGIDCVASVRRWMTRNGHRQALAGALLT